MSAKEILRHIRATCPVGMTTPQEKALHIMTSASFCADLLRRDATGKNARNMLRTASDLIGLAERHARMFGDNMKEKQ